MSVEHRYEELVRGLTEPEQVRLASFIMWRCGHSGRLEYSEEWSDEDLRDLAAHSLRRFSERFAEPKDEDDPTVTG